MMQGNFDEETLGILGRVHKEMWLIEGNGATDHPFLARSRELYMGAYRRSKGFYSGINAASLSLIMGDKTMSERLAREVIGICSESWKEPGPSGLLDPGHRGGSLSPPWTPAEGGEILPAGPGEQPAQLLQPGQHAPPAQAAGKLCDS